MNWILFEYDLILLQTLHNWPCWIVIESGSASTSHNQGIRLFAHMGWDTTLPWGRMGLDTRGGWYGAGPWENSHCDWDGVRDVSFSCCGDAVMVERFVETNSLNNQKSPADLFGEGSLPLVQYNQNGYLSAVRPLPWGRYNDYQIHKPRPTYFLVGQQCRTLPIYISNPDCVGGRKKNNYTTRYGIAVRGL